MLWWNAVISSSLSELFPGLGCTCEEYDTDLEKIKSPNQWQLCAICRNTLCKHFKSMCHEEKTNSKPSSKLPTCWIWLPWIWTRTLSLVPGTGCSTALAWTLCCRAADTSMGSNPYISRFLMSVTYRVIQKNFIKEHYNKWELTVKHWCTPTFLLEPREATVMSMGSMWPFFIIGCWPAITNWEHSCILLSVLWTNKWFCWFITLHIELLIFYFKCYIKIVGRD